MPLLLIKFTSIFLFVLIAIQLLTPTAQGANILFYFGLSGHSHISSIWPVIQQLAERGHNVTLLTCMAPKSSHPKVNVVHAVELYNVFKDQWDEGGGDFVADRIAGRHHDLMNGAVANGLETCAALFDDHAAHSLVYHDKFDIVIMDTIFNDCAFGLAYYQYKCPFILYSAFSLWTTYFDDYGLSVESSSVPDMFMGRPPTSFYERLLSTWMPIKWMYKRRTEYFPVLNKLFQDRLHLDETPNFQEIYSQTSLVLMNTHYSNDYARSLPPLFVSVAGIGIQHQRKPLPAELEDFITKPGSKGFVYVSFGTVVRIGKSNEPLRRKLFSAFGNISDYQFVWKWEEDIPEIGKAPSNIYFAKWLPQQDLLAHANVKGFVSHGGMNGVNEAVHYGVPTVFFPILCDQDYNAHTLAAKGMAIVMEIGDFTHQELTESLNKILHNEELRDQAKRYSSLFRDRPMKPLQTAIWWIEYVLRNERTSDFLMPRGAQQSWWQRRLLDVWFFVFAILTVALLAISFISIKVVSLLIAFCSKPSAKKLKTN